MRTIELELSQWEEKALTDKCCKDIMLAAEYFEDTELPESNELLLRWFMTHLRGSHTQRDALALVAIKMAFVLLTPSHVASWIRKGWQKEQERKKIDYNNLNFES